MFENTYVYVVLIVGLLLVVTSIVYAIVTGIKLRRIAALGLAVALGIFIGVFMYAAHYAARVDEVSNLPSVPRVTQIKPTKPVDLRFGEPTVKQIKGAFFVCGNVEYSERFVTCQIEKDVSLFDTDIISIKARSNLYGVYGVDPQTFQKMILWRGAVAPDNYAVRFSDMDCDEFVWDYLNRSAMTSVVNPKDAQQTVMVYGMQDILYPVSKEPIKDFACSGQQ